MNAGGGEKGGGDWTVARVAGNGSGQRIAAVFRNSWAPDWTSYILTWKMKCRPTTRATTRSTKSAHTAASRRRAVTSTMAMPPPKPKIGVDPARSRDIMDDMVNAVRLARIRLGPPSRRPHLKMNVPPSATAERPLPLPVRRWRRTSPTASIPSRSA